MAICRRPPLVGIVSSVNAQILIDAVVRQTTVLIAQLATSGGVRAPLARIASQVFLDLANELDAQGVSRKVSADMFGMALRAYLRKLQRLRESSTDQGQSLWSAVLDYLRDGGIVSRSAVLRRFHRDDEATVRGVLHDLTESGLIFRSGTGTGATYRAKTDDELSEMRGLADENVDEIVWLMIYREGPLTIGEVEVRTRMDASALAPVIARLSDAGRVRRDTRGPDPVYSSSEFVVGFGQSVGWEAAVLDHYQAVVRTICSRLQDGDAADPNRVGGSTYTYDVWPGHPNEDEVYGMLRDVRDRAGALRRRVEAYNAAHAIPADYVQVLFYGGQCPLAQNSPPGIEESDHEA
jgi:hypothetical protein